ncbi:GntR family transcriptional regulator [Cognatishimia sp. 1_MG-2023]|uniref:GntR family transcriptional regulator n=1 Tax=Cognatishimia sp. 1_MG-2023 TaxID=3062642 RepID=UPI0026E1A711|nr:GntR family transcriptional regulator [Cognatishimia sp. 1_MG-2023]MDO6727832.1 GntR family transcriptional regulator [Cognatishimia sp. 1_MG-2023]
MAQTTKITISDQIMQALTEQIVRGDLVPDEKLRQDHIAKTFETSHVPVREALLRLEARGLAVSLPRRGVRVAPFDPADMQEVREMRLALEPVALRHSVMRLTPEQRAKAEDARVACDTAKDIVTWERENRRFHLAILAACGMPRLLAEVVDLQLLSARHLLATYSKNWVERTDRDHRAIMLAIHKRDVDAAVSVLQRHLTRLA